MINVFKQKKIILIVDSKIYKSSLKKMNQEANSYCYANRNNKISCRKRHSLMPPKNIIANSFLAGLSDDEDLDFNTFKDLFDDLLYEDYEFIYFSLSMLIPKIVDSKNCNFDEKLDLWSIFLLRFFPNDIMFGVIGDSELEELEDLKNKLYNAYSLTSTYTIEQKENILDNTNYIFHYQPMSNIDIVPDIFIINQMDFLEYKNHREEEMDEHSYLKTQFEKYLIYTEDLN